MLGPVSVNTGGFRTEFGRTFGKPQKFRQSRVSQDGSLSVNVTQQRSKSVKIPLDVIDPKSGETVRQFDIPTRKPRVTRVFIEDVPKVGPMVTCSQDTNETVTVYLLFVKTGEYACVDIGEKYLTEMIGLFGEHFAIDRDGKVSVYRIPNNKDEFVLDELFEREIDPWKELRESREDFDLGNTGCERFNSDLVCCFDCKLQVLYLIDVRNGESVFTIFEDPWLSPETARYFHDRQSEKHLMLIEGQFRSNRISVFDICSAIESADSCSKLESTEKELIGTVQFKKSLTDIKYCLIDQFTLASVNDQSTIVIHHVRSGEILFKVSWFAETTKFKRDTTARFIHFDQNEQTLLIHDRTSQIYQLKLGMDHGRFLKVFAHFTRSADFDHFIPDLRTLVFSFI